MSNIKDIRYKPRLHDLVLPGVWPPGCVTSSSLGAAPAIHATSYVDHEKRVAWFSISMQERGSVPIMVLRLAALRVARAPL